MGRFLYERTGKCGYDMYLDDHRQKYGEKPPHTVLLDWDFIMPGQFNATLGINQKDVIRDHIHAAKLMSVVDGAYSIEMADGTLYEVWSKQHLTKAIRIDPENRAQYDKWQSPMPYMVWQTN